MPRRLQVSKLQQIQSLSSPAAAAAAASSSPAADSSPTIDLTHSPHVAPPVTIFLSDSDSDSDLPPATAAAARRGRPKRAKKSKTQLSLQAFLTTYFTKIHARYHDGSSREEMENILASYLRPALEPTVEVLEKQIPNRMSGDETREARAVNKQDMQHSHEHECVFYVLFSLVPTLPTSSPSVPSAPRR